MATDALPPETEPKADGKVDFSTALSIWRDINLVELRSTLNELAPSLLEAQKVSLLNRKKLAEQTREFKKQPDESKLEAINPLLKSYQVEIDTLTKRSKSAEHAFLNVHSALGSAPDPYPFLEVVLDQAASLNDLETLRTENAKLKQDNAELKSDSHKKTEEQDEKKRLLERVQQLEQGFEKRLQERNAAVEKELSAKWDERVRNLNEREKDLTKSLNLTQEQLKELRSKDESTTAKLLEQGQEEEERQTKGKLAEMQLLTHDLERAQARVESVERRNEQLRAEMESVKNGREENERIERLEKEALDKDARISQLQSLVETEREQLEAKAQEVQKAGEEKAKLQREKEAEVDSLRVKLAKCSDYEEIKRELEIVKMVEFSNENDDDDESADKDGEKWTGAGAKPLETLLLEKNRKLQDQLTNLRVAHDELTKSSQGSSNELDTLKKEVARIRSLNEKLENDLVSIGSNGPSATPKGAPSAGMNVEEALEEMDRMAAEPPRENGAAKPKTPVPTSAKSPKPEASPRPSSTQDTSILPIITSQRDRFRARNAELEEELRKQFETITELRSEIKTLQADNLGLYEKLRYLQAYGRGGDTVVDIAPYPPRRADGGDDKYRAKYEESMNPFEAFRGREQTRVLASLNPLERLLHMATRLVLGHRRMRLLFTAYAIFLHFMVFGMMFEVGHSAGDTCAVAPT